MHHARMLHLGMCESVMVCRGGIAKKNVCFTCFMCVEKECVC